MAVLPDRLAEPRTGGSPRDVPYRIPSHVHVCLTGDSAILLDLKRNKYFGIYREDAALLARAVRDWPPPLHGRRRDEESLGQDIDQDMERVCRSMVEEGLLLSGETPGSESRPRAELDIDMSAPFVSIGDELEVEAKTRLRHVARFAAAYARAGYSLRIRRLDLTVAAVRARKDRRLMSGAAWDLLGIAGLITVFRRLRPYVFAAEGRCLLHALTLVEFLSDHDVYPEWVIGVATQPWGAHSWVQWDGYLLDTNPEKVCRYTPILVV